MNTGVTVDFLARDESENEYKMVLVEQWPWEEIDKSWKIQEDKFGAEASKPQTTMVWQHFKPSCLDGIQEEPFTIMRGYDFLGPLNLRPPHNFTLPIRICANIKQWLLIHKIHIPSHLGSQMAFSIESTIQPFKTC